MSDSNTFRFSELLDWLEDRLPPDQARAVAEHIEAADTATQADLDWLRLFLRARQSVQFASPPSRVRETLKQRFAEYAQARQPPGLFQRWLATLTFDSRAHAATAGIRSVSDENSQQQLIYATEAAELALTIRAAPPTKNFVVAGQIFPAADIPADSFSIQLLRDVQEIDLAAADELGEFTFANVPAGDYKIVVSAGLYEIVIPSFHIRS